MCNKDQPTISDYRNGLSDIQVINNTLRYKDNCPITAQSRNAIMTTLRGTHAIQGRDGKQAQVAQQTKDLRLDHCSATHCNSKETHIQLCKTFYIMHVMRQGEP